MGINSCLKMQVEDLHQAIQSEATNRELLLFLMELSQKPGLRRGLLTGLPFGAAAVPLCFGWWFLWQRRNDISGKRTVLEVVAMAAITAVVAACGVRQTQATHEFDKKKGRGASRLFHFHWFGCKQTMHEQHAGTA